MSATATQQRKIVNRVIADYAGNYIYENNTLQFFNHPEGYVKPVIASGSTAISSFNYVYQYKDHLENVRLSYTDVSTTNIPVLEIIEESNYYPDGQHDDVAWVIGVGNSVYETTTTLTLENKVTSKYTNKNAPPPLFAACVGNAQILPKPMAEPAAARTKPKRE